MKLHPLPPRPARTFGLVLLACVAVLAAAAPGWAQRPPPPHSLRVLVRDAQTTEPVAGAQVHLGAGRAAAVTDAGGAAAISGLAPRSYVVRITHLAYEPYTAQVVVGPDGAAVHQASLAVRPVKLAEVAVEGPVRPRSRMLNRFYTRAATGSGSYLTRQDIDRINARRVSDLFRLLPGLVIVQNPGGEQRLLVEGNAARLEGATPGMQPRLAECPILYFLDGTPIEPLQNGSIDHEIRPSEIEGVEVYRRGTLAPAEFRRSGANCGIVLIWKRERI